MCGITGVLNLTSQDPVDPDRLKAANETLYHRGPDDDGIFVTRNIGIAMRRLSIIDLSRGHQPISNEESEIHIVYNGEVYNYRDLRAELKALGHRFLTNSDTEVVLHAYEEWDTELFMNRLRGMFAFAIWDNKTKTLLLARDRMGIKPLYFVEHAGRLYFASEIRGLLLHSRMPRQIDLRALESFMTVGFVPAPYTMFKGIRKLPAAHYLVSVDGKISIKKYWELSYECNSNQSQKELVEEFRELLLESVKMHLMSEVPLGALLSGGIDSVTNIALIRSIVQSPVKTINIRFEARSYDEAKRAEAAAHALGTDHHSVTFSGDSLDEYPRILFYREEPIADPTFTALYYLFQACREHNLTVVLSGEGADELLGGYHWHRGEHWVRPLLKLPYPMRFLLAENPVIRSRGDAGLNMANILHRAPRDIHKRYQAWISIGDINLATRLLSPEVKAVLRHNGSHSILESWLDYLSPVAEQPVLDQMLWLQSRTRLVDWINHGVDRMSMAHSVEARPPFLDHKLWEFCARVPHKLKLHGLYFRLTEKYLLREAGRDLVPHDVRVRKKKPLSVPYGSWLSRRRLPEWAETALSNMHLKKLGLFDPDAVVELRKHHQAGAPGRATLLMGILCIQTWANLFFESSLETGPL